jgi:AcrR family transcriptional regulator
MAEARAVKATATYHSPLRARQAAETRRSIIEAALALFAEQGWAATALPAIAKRAGVSVDTIYSTFGNKSALLMAVVHVAIVGDDDDDPMVDRADFAAFSRGRRHERLRTGVRYTMAVYERSIPILETLREAAASDDAARERLTRYDHDRRELIAAGVALIVGHEPTETAFWQMALSAPCFGLAEWLVTPTPRGPVTWPSVWGLLYQGIVVSGVAFVAWIVLLRRHSPGRLTVFSFTVPLFGVVLSHLLFGEAVTPRLVIGGVMAVVVGIAMASRSSRPPSVGEAEV